MVKSESLQIGHSHNKGMDFKIERDIDNEMNIEVSFSHRHTFYAIYWIHKGKGVHIIDFKDYEIKAGRIFYIRPGQVHFFRIETEINYSALQFTEEFMLPYYDFNLEKWQNIAAYEDMDAEKQKRLRILFDLMYNEFRQKSPESRSILQSELNTLMLELERMDISGANIQKLPELLLRYKKLVNEQYFIHHQVKEYASQLGVSPNYLNVLSQKHWGESALSLINKRLILEIKRMLLRSNDNISEIAYHLNFNELSYFSRFFKRNEGLTPNEFRTQMNKIYQK